MSELPLSITCKSSTADPTPTLLLEVTVIWKSPARVGVPFSTPFAVLKAKPGGKGLAV